MGPLMGPHDPIWGQWNPITPIWGQWTSGRAGERVERARSSWRARTSGRARACAQEWALERSSAGERARAGELAGALFIDMGPIWAPYGAPYGPIWVYGVSWSP
jgi:hypothetical protein